MSSESAEQSVLVTQERPASSEYVESAKDWPLWSSVTHEDGSGKFHFSYNGDYTTERTLIVTGTATLTPTDGSPPIKIQAGDLVWFHKGFICNWEVHTPMTKRYEYFDADGNVKKPAAIACDGCGKDCEPESYFVGGEEDFCPTCYKKGNYTNGEHQKMGVKVVEESEPAKKKAKTSH